MKNIIVSSLGDSSWKTIPQIPLGYLYCSCPTKKKVFCTTRKLTSPSSCLCCSVLCVYGSNSPGSCAGSYGHLQLAVPRTGTLCRDAVQGCITVWRNTQLGETALKYMKCLSLNFAAHFIMALWCSTIKPSPSHHWFMEICITAFSTQGKNLDFSHFFKQLCKPLNIPS